MKASAYLVLFLSISLFAISCNKEQVSESTSNVDQITRSNEKTTENARAILKKLQKFAKPKTPPRSYDWLASYNEAGQTFEEYVSSNPTIPATKRNKVYIMPIGSFSAAEDRVLRLTAEYIKAFYGHEIGYLPAIQLAKTTKSKFSRMVNNGKTIQFKTGHILNDILKPNVPDDAVALIGFTAVDLYPNDDMSYVFGQASFNDRIGIWSLYRLKQNTSKENFLLRSMKTAVHETGHMFSIRHCIKYECVMNGTNHLEETDSSPSDTCPECTAKIAWANREKASERYARMLKYYRSNGMKTEASDIDKKLKAIGDL